MTRFFLDLWAEVPTGLFYHSACVVPPPRHHHCQHYLCLPLTLISQKPLNM